MDSTSIPNVVILEDDTRFEDICERKRTARQDKSNTIQGGGRAKGYHLLRSKWCGKWLGGSPSASCHPSHPKAIASLLPGQRALMCTPYIVLAGLSGAFQGSPDSLTPESGAMFAVTSRLVFLPSFQGMPVFSLLSPWLGPHHSTRQVPTYTCRSCRKISIPPALSTHAPQHALHAGFPSEQSCCLFALRSAPSAEGPPLTPPPATNSRRWSTHRGL